MKTGDKVRYTADVHPDYTGKEAMAIEFDLKNRMVNMLFADGELIWAFWDEIEEVD